LTNISLKILKRNIGNKIINSGFKQVEIAQKLNISNSTVSKWISGELTPTAKNLIELARVIKVDVADFWKDVDTLGGSSESRELFMLHNRLDKKQLGAVLLMIRSMLPEPEEEEIIETVKALNVEQKKALIDFAKSSNLISKSKK